MVLVSHDRAFVFLKTRKTASTSIEMLLEPFCAAPGHIPTEATDQIVGRHGIIGARMTAPRRRWFRPTWRNHKSAAAVRRDLGRRKWDRYTKVTSVRNPFDRMVSLYHWTVQGSGTQPTVAGFRDWVAGGDWPDDENIVSIDGTWVIDAGIRFEHLADDLRTLGERLGLGIDAGQLHWTKPGTGPGGLIADYYDRPTVDTVRHRLSWVFDHFDYPDTPLQPGRGS